MKEMEKKSFGSRLAPYSKPVINVVVGFIASCVQGSVFPVFGVFMSKMLFAYMNPDKH